MKKAKFDSLSNEVKKLLVSAKNIRMRAHVPFTNYPVGVAIESEGGRIFYGCNVEITSLNPTIHAEQAAIAAMIAAGEKRIKKIALITEHGGPPCAFDSQVIWDFCNNNYDIEIICAKPNLDEVNIFTIKEIYPFLFAIDRK